MILKKLQQEILNRIIMMIETLQHFFMIMLCLNLNFLPEIHIAVLKKDKKTQKHNQYLYITYLQFEKSFSVTLFQ